MGALQYRAGNQDVVRKRNQAHRLNDVFPSHKVERFESRVNSVGIVPLISVLS
jgi:hypothetical protein